MKSVKLFAFCCTLISFSEVLAWTIDLPEIRKQYFHNADEKQYFHNTAEEHHKNTALNDNQYNFYQDRSLFSNVQSNSVLNDEYLNQDIYNSEKYAHEYEYQSYMEKKVDDIVKKGSIYLDGLRLAIENYTVMLEECNRMNSSMLEQYRPSNISGNNTYRSQIDMGNYTITNEMIAQLQQGNYSGFNLSLPYMGNQFSQLQQANFSGFNQLFPFMNQFRQPRQANFTGFNQSFPFTGNQSQAMRCERATRDSEHVRRWAQLALWATRRLQDQHYRDKYDRYTLYHDSIEEKALLMRLAYFLDRLAHLTGYDPNAKEFVTSPAPRTTTEPSNISIMPPVPDSVKNRMMKCLDDPSPVPAAVRCNIPLTDATPASSPASNAGTPPTVTPSQPASGLEPNAASSFLQQPFLFVDPNAISLEKLITAENQTPLSNLAPTLIAVTKRVQKRSTNDNPMMNFLKYYGKHKVWEGANPGTVNDMNDVENGQDFHVQNEIQLPKSKEKRSVDRQLVAIRFSDHPLEELGHFIRHKVEEKKIKHKIHIEEFKHYLDKFKRVKDLASLHIAHKLEKLKPLKIDKRSINSRMIGKLRKKRSTYYYNKIHPFPSENPVQDISYYVKNKEGVEYNYNLVQAALVRASLEAAFQRGNILVVQRYGSNPVLVNNIGEALAKTLVDP